VTRFVSSRAIAFLLVLLCHTAALADQITWRLLFTGSGGETQGTGQFTYDPDTSVCIPNNPIGCDPPFPGSDEILDGFFVSTLLQSISVDLGGFDWGSGTARDLAGLAWWGTDTFTPGIVFGGRFGPDPQLGRWLFWDDEFTQFEILQMTGFQRKSPTGWEGDWSAEVRNPDTQEALFSSSGRFAATLVPEPASFCLLLLAGTGCLRFRRIRPRAT